MRLWTEAKAAWSAKARTFGTTSISTMVRMYLYDYGNRTNCYILVADLYIDLYNAIIANPNEVGHGREGIYFGENGEHSMYEVGKVLAQLLVDAGKGKSPEPATFTQEEVDKYFGVCFYFAVIHLGLTMVL
jgi:hypothetical protein